MTWASSRTPVVWLLLCVALATGCQVTDPQGQLRPSGSGGGQDGAAAPALGSPDEDFPTTVAELRAFALPEAQAWQDAPVLADLTVWLQPDGRWERTALTWIAGEAERMLIYRAEPDEVRVEFPQLLGLQLMVVSTAGVEQVEPFPDGALEPVALADAAQTALADCDAAGEEVAAVLFATGAPAAWDGNEWTRTPTWRATVVTQSVGVVVDPESGQAFAPLTCVEPFLVSGE